MNEAKLFKSRIAYFAIILLCSFAISYYLWGPNLHAAFGLHEDNLIVSILGEDRKLTFAEFPTLLAETDLGAWGESLRLRPSFWELKLFECWLWGDSPFLWYLSHLCIFFLWVVVLWHVLARRIGLVYGGLFVSFTLLFPFWSDLFAWLAPSEIYAVLGLALYAPGFLNYWQELKTPGGKTRIYLNVQLMLMILGGLIAIGSKENFVILIFPTLFLQAYAWLKKKSHAMLLLSTGVQLGYAVFIASGILLALSKAGSDVYQRDVNAQSLSALLLQIIPKIVSAFNLPFMYGILLLLGIAVRVFSASKTREYFVYMRNYSIATGGLVAVYLSQAVFYSGQWPTEMRYDFPGVLAIPFFYLATLLAGFKIVGLLQVPKKILHGLLACAIVALYLMSPYHIDELARSRQRSVENVERTTFFQHKLQALISQIIDLPEIPLIFESFDALDYEPIFSLREYLYTYGVRQNSLYLFVHPYPEESLERPIEKHMANNLQLLHTYGGEGFLPMWQFPESTERCFAITFSGDTQTACKSFKIWSAEE